MDFKQPVRVIYLDDEPALLDVAKRYLEQDAEIQVDITTSPHEALDLIASRRYDAIITDYLMPDMDGLAVLRQVRAINASIPVIFLSGKSTRSVVIDAINHGADFFLEKNDSPGEKLTELSLAIKQSALRYRTQLLLEASEEKFRTIIDNTFDWIYWIDPQGTLLYISPSCLQVTGYTPDEFYQNPDLLNRIIIENSLPTRSPQQEVLPGQESRSIEFQIRRKDGDVRWIRHTSHPVSGEDGSFRGIRVNNWDITEQIQAEAVIRSHAKRYLSILKASPDGLYQLDAEGRFVDLNDRFCQMTGYTRDHLLSMQISDLEAIETREETHTHISQVIREGFDRFETRIRHRDGTLLDVEMSATHLQEEQLIIVFAHDVSHRILEQEARQKDAEEIFDLYNNAPCGYHSVDPDGFIININNTELSWLGYQREDIIGKVRFSDLLTRESREQYTSIVSESTVQDDTYSLEVEMVRSDGTVFPVLLSATTRTGPDGEFIMSRSMIFDLTERKKIEQRVALLALDYQTIFDNVPAMIWYKDTKNTLLRVNASGASYFGRPKEEIEGRKVSDLFPDLADHYYQDDLEVIRSGKPKTGIIEQMTVASGETTWVQTDKIPVRDINGIITGVLVFVVDITERRHAEEELRMHGQIIDTIAEGVALTRTDTWEIVYTNPKFDAMFGYARGEFMGARLSDIQSPDKESECQKRLLTMMKAIDETGEWSGEVCYHRKDKSQLCCHVTVSSFSHPVHGKVWISTYVDIMDQKRASDALALASKKVNLMSSITRHDIINQITALNGYISFSKDIARDPDLMNYIQKMEKIAAMIHREIQFTRDYQDLGLNTPTWQQIDTTISRVARSLQIGDIRVDVECPGLMIYADPLLEKVFYNLIDNALRYGGDTMTMIRFSYLHQGEDLMIIGEDDGAGISAEDKIRLFTRGFGKHTGLGLFLSREILSITGITIQETGIPGKGARFEILVPSGQFQNA